MSKKFKFEWSSQEMVGYLESQIQPILEACAEACNCPGMAHAYVSDRSSIDDFLMALSRNREGDPTREEAIIKISEILGVEIVGDELLTDLARTLAGLNG
jgi:hypothetical protein